MRHAHNFHHHELLQSKFRIYLPIIVRYITITSSAVHLCALYFVTVLEFLCVVLIGLTIQACKATDQVSDIFSASTHPISRCLI
ncbi:hypothetical protein P692DRAFT_201405117 [Suillus brevipes Sb2]|nr:hypothetical protein P692DRAFT_201405117 [Suillus brevipes Sb2]